MSAGAVLLKDPFSDETRRRRRNLLVASTVAILISAAGWLPNEISTLGLTFELKDQQIFLWLVFSVLLYLLLAFLTSAWAELLGYQTEIDSSWNKPTGKPSVPWQIAASAYGSRLILDWLFPIGFAGLALVSVTWFASVGPDSGFSRILLWMLRIGSALILLLAVVVVAAWAEETFMVFLSNFRRWRRAFTSGKTPSQ